MIDKNSLTEINQTPFEFIEYVSNYNLECIRAYLEPSQELDNRQLFQNRFNEYYDYTKYCNLFFKKLLELIKESKYDIKIYEGIKNRDLAYYIIDSTGLSYGYLIKSEPLICPMPLYGKPYNKVDFYSYDCINWHLEEYGHHYLTIANFRNKFLPYLSKYKSNVDIFRSKAGRFGFNEIIRNNDTASYIPFVALIMEKLTRYGFPKIKEISFDTDYISFVAIHKYRERKHNYEDHYRGTISYTEFEIMEFENYHSWSEYDD
jgi:hypothetical protein